MLSRIITILKNDRRYIGNILIFNPGVPALRLYVSFKSLQLSNHSTINRNVEYIVSTIRKQMCKHVLEYQDSTRVYILIGKYIHKFYFYQINN